MSDHLPSTARKPGLTSSAPSVVAAELDPPTPRKRKAPGPRHEDKRVAILRTAAQLFADNGYEATSLDKIADQLGMHKATLYHYVSNKESILYQCLVLVGSRPLDMMPGGEIRQFQRRLDETVRALIVEGIADGSIKPCHPGLVSSMLFGSLNWVPRWYQEGGKLSIEQVVDSFMDVLTSGIAAPRR